MHDLRRGCHCLIGDRPINDLLVKLFNQMYLDVNHAVRCSTVWSVLEQRVYRTRIRDVNHVKTHLVEEWQKFDQKIIDWAIKQWRPRFISEAAVL